MRWASAALVRPDAGAQLEHVDPRRGSPPAASPCRGSGAAARRPAASAWSFPAPLGPSSTQRSSSRTVQSTERSSSVALPRTTSTPESWTTTELGTEPIQPTRPLVRREGPGVGHDDRVVNRAAGPAVEVWPGSPAPLGAHWDGTGTNVALWSAGASAVDLCLFRPRRQPSTGSGCRRPRTRSGTAGCPAWDRASATATGCTAATTRPPAPGTTRPSCCWTPTPAPSTAT